MKNLEGQEFGFLKVLHREGKLDNGGITWKCLCVCGNTVDRPGASLLSKRTNSCGCRRGTHRMSHSKEYSVWSDMKQRCLNCKHPSFMDYGGRGIKIGVEWLDFNNFYADMGKCPDEHSLERTDNSRGYIKDNCKWASTSEQSLNKRSTRFVFYENKYYTVKHLSEKLGINYSTLYDRFIRPNRKRK